MRTSMMVVNWNTAFAGAVLNLRQPEQRKIMNSSLVLAEHGV
jgi:hypothetical protein